MNIDKQLLFQLVCKQTVRDEIRWLASTVIFHDCTEDYSFKGQRSLLELIPPHKTLFKVDRGKGLPIGNLTSQFFANVFLNELDQFVKRKLGCRYYLRYCDDFLLLSDSREQLLAWHGAIDEFLRARLMLALNPGQFRLRPVSSGIDFLGYIVRRQYMLVRRRVVNHFRERLEFFDRQLASRNGGQSSPVDAGFFGGLTASWKDNSMALSASSHGAVQGYGHFLPWPYAQGKQSSFDTIVVCPLSCVASGILP